MKKIILTTMVITPLILSPTILGNDIKKESISIETLKSEKNSVFETITENDAVASEGTGSTKADYTWTFELSPLMEHLSIDYIDSIHIFEQEVNFLYKIEWKERGFLDVPAYNWNDLMTMSGPGDANGHTGWNEADLDGHEGDGGVKFNDTTLTLGSRAKITSGWTVTHYDEYMDDGYGWEDNGSGYHWEDYSIYGTYYTQDNKYFLGLDWEWDSTMSYDVQWNKLNNTDGKMDTIGEFEVEFYY